MAINGNWKKKKKTENSQSKNFCDFLHFTHITIAITINSPINCGTVNINTTTSCPANLTFQSPNKKGVKGEIDTTAQPLATLQLFICLPPYSTTISQQLSSA